MTANGVPAAFAPFVNEMLNLLTYTVASLTS